MGRWLKRVRLKHLLTNDIEDVAAMRAVADVLAGHSEFAACIRPMRVAAEECDGELFNIAMDRMYDIADRHRVWIE